MQKVYLGKLRRRKMRIQRMLTTTRATTMKSLTSTLQIGAKNPKENFHPVYHMASRIVPTMVMVKIKEGGGKEPRVNLTAEQADALLGHSGRVQSLGQAKEVLKNLGGALAASMTNTLDRVIKDETKRFNQRMQGDAVVDKELRASLEAEEKRCARQRIELQEHMQLVREKNVSSMSSRMPQQD